MAAFHSTFDVGRSTFSVRCSKLDAKRFTSGIRPLTPLCELPVLILDCQATGPSSAGGHLLEIGWVRTRASDAGHCPPEQAAAFCLRLPAGATIPRRVRQVTGLDEAAAQSGEAAARVWRRLLRSDPARPIPTLIHHARFERPFLQRLHDAQSPDRPFPLDLVCTHELARRLLPEGREPALRLSNQVLLGPSQIGRVLWWV